MTKQHINILATITIFLLLKSPVAAELSTPIDKQAYSIGAINNGCISGAQALPLQGVNFIAINLQRRRYYGHPILIKTLQLLAKKAHQHQVGFLQIGDLGQSQGGPLAYGHHSHQTGLDADIWFNLSPESFNNTNKDRSNISQASMLKTNRLGLNSLWNDKHRKLLQIAANIEEVDRIFVNPYIKRDLCKTIKGDDDRHWLKKIRPWYGHDEHFHIRLHCPETSPNCIKQAPIPDGESCDATLDWWFQKHPVSKLPKAKSSPALPTACHAILSNK